MSTRAPTPGFTYLMATHSGVSALEVGDLAPDPFGRMMPVVEITARRVDVEGKLFVCYYTDTGHGSRISGSIKAGELVRHAGLSGPGHSSADLDAIELRLRLRYHPWALTHWVQQ